MSDAFGEAVQAFLKSEDQTSVAKTRRLFSEVNAGWVDPFACACIPDCLCARQREEGAQQVVEAP